MSPEHKSLFAKTLRIWNEVATWLKILLQILILAAALNRHRFTVGHTLYRQSEMSRFEGEQKSYTVGSIRLGSPQWGGVFWPVLTCFLNSVLMFWVPRGQVWHTLSSYIITWQFSSSFRGQKPLLERRGARHDKQLTHEARELVSLIVKSGDFFFFLSKG